MKQFKYIEGWSESVWKSLVVKALRIGWVEGLQKAHQVMGKSAMRQLLVAGLFEDVYPAGFAELDECIAEIEAADYEALCQRQTHHSRGLTPEFFRLAEEACTIGKTYGDAITKELKENTNVGWINPRIYNCLYTWRKMNPKDTNKKRKAFHMKWSGMPECVLDAHTFEGKKKGNDVTLLSGHYENHDVIGKRVMKEGWSGLRLRFSRDPILVGAAPVQISMF